MLPGQMNRSGSSLLFEMKESRLSMFQFQSGAYSREIATYFPGRTRKAVEFQYWLRKKEMKEVFTPEKVVSRIIK